MPEVKLETTDVLIKKLDAVWIRIECEKSILYEIYDSFSFYAKNYKFHPKFKNKIWDGQIHLVNLSTRKMHQGLTSSLSRFLEKSGYSYLIIDAPGVNIDPVAYDDKILSDLKYEPRDYQIEAVKFALNNTRSILLSPTGSGKSFIIWMILMHLKLKTLVIVPTVSLVHQLTNDFIDYTPKAVNWIQKLSTADKTVNKPVVISTWQGIYKQDKDFFSQFDCIIGDECHLYTASSLVGIMEKCVNIHWRIGTTGTIDDTASMINPLSLEGLFGTIYKVSSTKELMDQNYLSKFKIKALVLKYDKKTGQEVRKLSYHDELDYFVNNVKRNNFIVNLAVAQTKNTLVLFQFVEKHGKILYDLISEKAPEKNVYYISGEINGKRREEIRNAVNSSENNIIVASFATTATGINLPSLSSIIFASGYKSKVKNLQSIGRVLRTFEGKEIAILYDIVDDCSVKTHKNYAVKHFLERVKIYNDEQLDFKIHNIDFNQQ